MGVISLKSSMVRIVQQTFIYLLRSYYNISYIFSDDNNPCFILVSGVYMISDGVNRDFGFEGLQALGRSPCSRVMKILNAHGCFQLNSIALKSISKMCNLEVLILSGCTNLHTDTMIGIAQSCVKIKVLSFASCSDCITNTMLEKIGPHLSSLEYFNLTDCKKIGRVALRGLSHCRKLSHLDLSGCTGLTNDAILALCEGTFEPGIRVLRLERCVKISNHSLNWICQGLQDKNGGSAGEITLLILAVKNTK